VVLLLAAYSPVALIIGLRSLPAKLGWLAIAVGVLGILIWVACLGWLPDRQRRTSIVEDAQFIDSEVTGYIVSILLPVVAASRPGPADWVAYCACAILILLVAFAAELWSVNPITYAFNMRAARAVVDGKPQIVLVRGQLESDGAKVIVRRVGVTLVLGPATKENTSP
jgi:hypothetical protein